MMMRCMRLLRSSEDYKESAQSQNVRFKDSYSRNSEEAKSKAPTFQLKKSDEEELALSFVNCELFPGKSRQIHSFILTPFKLVL